MPDCQNCGAFVTREFARVFSPEGEAGPRQCLECSNEIGFEPLDRSVGL